MSHQELLSYVNTIVIDCIVNFHTSMRVYEFIHGDVVLSLTSDDFTIRLFNKRTNQVVRVQVSFNCFDENKFRSIINTQIDKLCPEIKFHRDLEEVIK